MGLVSLGDDAAKHASHRVGFGNQVTDFFLRTCVSFAVTMEVELDHVVRLGKTSTPHSGDDRTVQC